MLIGLMRPPQVPPNAQEIAGSPVANVTAPNLPDFAGRLTESEQDALSRSVLDPAVSAALVAQAYGQKSVKDTLDLSALVDELEAAMRQIATSDLSQIEATLTGQAAALQSIFTALSVRAMRDFDQSQAGTQYLKLALRAQAQCRATLETLAAMKRPASATIFARQANVAAGHQQINNAVPLCDGLTSCKCGCRLV